MSRYGVLIACFMCSIGLWYENILWRKFDMELADKLLGFKLVCALLLLAVLPVSAMAAGLNEREYLDSQECDTAEYDPEMVSYIEDCKLLKETKKAANQGDATAQVYLGVMYEEGDIVEQNYEKAIEWYRRSAAQGNSLAQYKLGQMYTRVDGTYRNIPKGFEWYTKAAKQGEFIAQYELAVMYGEDKVNTWSHKELKEWFDKTCDNGMLIGCESNAELDW